LDASCLCTSCTLYSNRPIAVLGIDRWVAKSTKVSYYLATVDDCDVRPHGYPAQSYVLVGTYLPVPLPNEPLRGRFDMYIPPFLPYSIRHIHILLKKAPSKQQQTNPMDTLLSMLVFLTASTVV
jgi:hypothetical protein